MALPLIVTAFERAALSSPERIRAAARRLAAMHDEPAAVVGVLSAMGGTTDDLLALARRVSDDPDPRELDMLVTTGERIACALCAMALLDLGKHAVSLTGSQAGIVTDSTHGGGASIVDVRPDRVRAELATGAVVLVAGFQGVSTQAEVTTLDGGARASAIALARSLGADRCEVVTDDPEGPADLLRPARVAPLPLERSV